jgi:hypothetical protein
LHLLARLREDPAIQDIEEAEAFDSNLSCGSDLRPCESVDWQEVMQLTTTLLRARKLYHSGKPLQACRHAKIAVITTNSLVQRASPARIAPSKLLLRTEALLLMATIWDSIGVGDR